ncbi:esterase-like activity of phytase family protein [Kineosporia sp. J2-2]|uniref:Esterase-like activity of phytase family protein n=1 Tax=Kineosporia corallincola TaxID=2835133 RepID=A0ABS5T941_9ACTN|nr:esterase-like activity of phytase family protein [Kineosporia corallincola]MBT0767586.1 esterase-like activity of phytase family protein [Kineosporia corallincola]
MSRSTSRAIAVVAATALAGAAVAVATAPSASAGNRGGAAFFNRTDTYAVYQNRPSGDAVADETVAEISTVTQDGRTMIYTDAAGKRIGFLDISNPEKIKGLGTLSLEELGDTDDQPTSVTVVGDYVLVVVDTSKSFTEPSGRVDVIRIKDRTRVRSIDLGGQPDSIAVDKKTQRVAIAMENQRDEEATPAGGEEGDLPQLPAGFVQIIELGRVTNPASWTAHRVSLTNTDGTALKSLKDAGLDTPTDPEPEYVSFNEDGTLAVTLQENNGIVLIDGAKHKITRVFSAGTATVTGIDTEDDGVIDQTGSITDTPREPDAVAWLDNRYLATANEGDWKGGTRGWTVFDSKTGKVAWDAGNTLEKLAVQNGLHSESRAGKKGIEPEGLATAEYNGVNYAFVGSERSNFVAVYDIENPLKPKYVQMLATTNGPEGILPITSRGLLAVSSEVDDAESGVRATVSLYRIGAKSADFPQIQSASSDIGWGTLGALSAVPGKKNQLVSVTDAGYSTTGILTIDTSKSPARITKRLAVTDSSGTEVGLDAEGVYARPQGGYWLAVEGASGAENKLVRVSAEGVVAESVALPEEVAAGLKSQGFEGVTATTDKSGEHVYAVIQRASSTDPAGVARIGRYDVRTGDWTWYGYQLETTSTDGDWIGLSEITSLGDNRFAVIERDKLNGPNARVKRIYTVTLPKTDPADGTLPVLKKKLAKDVLPDLEATNGWTQEKLEGLTVGGDGRVYISTDNDALDDSTGETVFMSIGKASKIFKK